MGDDHRRRVRDSERLEHLGTDLRAQPGVEGRERLVEHHDGWSGGQGSCKGDPVLLTTGEFVGSHPFGAGQADQFEHFGDAPPMSILAGEAEPDVAGHAEVGEERALLWHHAHPSTLGCHRSLSGGDHLVADGDRATIGHLEPGHDAQQRGLAATRRTEDRSDAARRHDQVDTAQHVMRPEGLGDAVDAQCGIHDRLGWRPRADAIALSSAVGMAAKITSARA